MPGNQLALPNRVSQTILNKMLGFYQTAQNDLSIRTESIMGSMHRKMIALVEEELAKFKNLDADLERQVKDQDALLLQKEEKILKLEDDLVRSEAELADLKAALRKAIQEMSPSRFMGGRRESCVGPSDAVSSPGQQAAEPPHQLKRRRSSSGFEAGSGSHFMTTKSLRPSTDVEDEEYTSQCGAGIAPPSSPIPETPHASKIRRVSPSQEVDLGAESQKNTISPELHASGIFTASTGVDAPMDMNMKVLERDYTLPVIISSQIEMDTDDLPLPLTQQRIPYIPAANSSVPQALDGNDMAAFIAPAPTSAVMPAMTSLAAHTMHSLARTPTIKNNQAASDAMPTTMADMPVMNMAAAEARTSARKEKAYDAPWWADETAKASTTTQAGPSSATMPDVMVASASPIMAERSVTAPSMARNADMHMDVGMAPSLAKASAFMTPPMDSPLDLTSITASPLRTLSVSNGLPTCHSSTDHVVLPIELDHVINNNFTNANDVGVVLTQANTAARLDEHKRASKNAFTRNKTPSSHASGLKGCSSSLRSASGLAKDGSPRSLPVSDDIRHSNVNADEGEATLEGNGADRENQELTVSVRSSSTSTAFSTASKEAPAKADASPQDSTTAKNLSLPPSPLLDHTALLPPQATHAPAISTVQTAHPSLQDAVLLELYASRTNLMQGRKEARALQSPARIPRRIEQQLAVAKRLQPASDSNQRVSSSPALGGQASIPTSLPSTTAAPKPTMTSAAVPSSQFHEPATTPSAVPSLGRYQVLPRIPKIMTSRLGTTSTPLPIFPASCDDFGFPRRGNTAAAASLPPPSPPSAPVWSEGDLFVRSQKKPDTHHDRARWKEEEDLSMILFRILFALSRVSHGSVHRHVTCDVQCRICLQVVASRPHESFGLDDDLRQAVNDHCKTHKDAVSALRKMPFLERQRAKRELEEEDEWIKLQCSDSVSYVLLGDSNFDSLVTL